MITRGEIDALAARPTDELKGLAALVAGLLADREGGSMGAAKTYRSIAAGLDRMPKRTRR